MPAILDEIETVHELGKRCDCVMMCGSDLNKGQLESYNTLAHLLGGKFSATAWISFQSEYRVR